MNKKIGKKNSVDFLNKLFDILKDFEAIETESQTSLKTYKLNTVVGLLNISLESIEDLKESSVYTIFTRFEIPEKARKLYGCNIYSGKYNFHTIDKEECIINFKNFLSNLIHLKEVNDY